MDEDEFDLPQASPLKSLLGEDLTVHSVEALQQRMTVLKAEISRTAREIENKKNVKSAADIFFKS